MPRMRLKKPPLGRKLISTGESVYENPPLLNPWFEISEREARRCRKNSALEVVDDAKAKKPKKSARGD